MDISLLRLEQAMRVLLEHDRSITTGQVLVFLEVARATDGVEVKWIGRHLGAPGPAVVRALQHLTAVHGVGEHAALHRLIEVRDPPMERRRHVAYLSREGRELARELHRVIAGGGG